MFPTVPHVMEDAKRHLRLLAESVNGLMAGKTNNTGEVTLTENAATTTLTDPRISVFSVVVFDPCTANAAAELAAGTLYATKANRNNGEWTLTNANNAQTDRTFRYAIVGGEGYRYSS